MKSNVNKYRLPLLQLGLVCSMATVLITFEWRFEPDEIIYGGGGWHWYKEVLMEIVPPPSIDQEPTPKIFYPTYKEVPDDEEVKDIDTKLIAQIELDWLEEIPSPEPTQAEIDELDSILTVCDLPKADTLEIEEIICVDNDRVVVIVEQPATFEGGMPAFFKYVGQNINYPRQAKRMNIESKIFVSFIINRDGTLSDIEVIRGECQACNEEVIRVLQSSPKWIPAKQRGRTVRQKMTLPIYFHLNQ